MEKILIAIDSLNFDGDTVRFGCHLARMTNSKLTAIFLEDKRVSRKLAFEAIAEQDAMVSETLLEIELENQELSRLRDRNILLFKEITRDEGVHSAIYLDRGVPVEDLVSESLFADLLILGANTFAGFTDDPPTPFVKDVIHDAGCPVLIAPEVFTGIDSLVFCYDGGRSSLLAMKQFAHLFPGFGGRKIKVVDLKNEAGPIEQARVITWLKTHYSSIEWFAGTPEEQKAFFCFLREKANDLVVMGAYGKGLLNSFFAEDGELGITRANSVPLFIAHY